MEVRDQIVAFNSHMLLGLIINDSRRFSDELAAFRVAFQDRRFPILVTDGILIEYMDENNRLPAGQIQPKLNELYGTGRVVRKQEHLLERFPIDLQGLPDEHPVFILDALAAHASYLITDRRRWLQLSEQLHDRYGLQIVTPGRFVELEG